jgi:hypothetical protein
LLYFVTHWSYGARRLYSEAAELRGFQELFLHPDRSDPYLNAVDEVMAEYMTQLGMDQRFLPLLLVYTYIGRALDRYNRQQVLTEVGTDVRTNNRYIKYIGMLAEHIERLFASKDIAPV